MMCCTFNLVLLLGKMSIDSHNSRLSKKSAINYAFTKYYNEFAALAEKSYFFKVILYTYFIEGKKMDSLTLDYIKDVYEKEDKTEAIKMAWGYLKYEGIPQTVKVLKTFHESKELAERMSISWQTLINEVKQHHLTKNMNIQLLPFDENSKAKIQNIISPLEILKVNAETIFSTNSEKSNYNYKNFHNIFNTEFNKIIVQGEPGIGKSVQVKYLMNCWALNKWDDVLNDKLFLVIYIKNVLNNEDIFDSILKSNFPGDTTVTKDNIRDFFEEKQMRDVFLLLDGGDEIDKLKLLNENKEYCIQNFIDSSNCPIPTVVWCRNWKSIEILSTCDVAFELIGFNSDQLKKYFETNFINMPCDEFVYALNKGNGNIKSFCRIPLLATIIFYLYHEKKFEFEYDNLYTIYENAIELIFIKNGIELNDLTMETIYRQSFLCLADNRIGMKIDKNQLKSFHKVFKCFAQIFNNSDNPEELEIQYFHLSIQEFFAAKHIITKYMENRIQTSLYIDKQLKDKKVLNIYNTMNLLKEKDESIFKHVLLNSMILEKAFQLSDNIKSILTDDSGNNSKVQLTDETISYLILDLVIEKIKNSIQELILQKVKTNFKRLLLKISNTSMIKLKKIHLSIENFNHLVLNDAEVMKQFLVLLQNDTLRYFDTQRFHLNVIFENDVKCIKIGNRFNSFNISANRNLSNSNNKRMEIQDNGSKFKKMWQLLSITDGFDNLINEIIKYYSLTTFDIHEQYLSENQLKALTIMFSTFSQTLSNVKLNVGKLNESTAKILYSFMDSLTYLKSFSLTSSKSDSGTKCFIDKIMEYKRTSLESLKIKLLSYTSLECISLSGLLEKFPKLRYLEISGLNVTFANHEMNDILLDEIENICLENCFLNDKQAEIIVNKIHNNSNFDDLLRNRQLGDALIVLQRHFLDFNKTLRNISIKFSQRFTYMDLRGKVISLSNCHLQTIENVSSFDKNNVFQQSLGLRNFEESIPSLSIFKCHSSDKNNDCQQEILCSYLRSCKNLEHFHIQSENDVFEYKTIFHSLSSSSKNFLKVINVSSAIQSEASGLAFAELLDNCKCLENIDISSNSSIGEREFEKILLSLANSLAKLSHLNLSKCNLSTLNIKTLNKLLKQCSSVVYIDISFNKSVYSLFNSLVESLKQSSGVFKHLNVSNCSITNESAHEGLNNLRYFPHLEFLDVSSNAEIGSAIARLKKSLENSNSLKYLKFNNCNISKQFRRRQTVKNQWFPALEYLDCSCNPGIDNDIGIIVTLLGRSFETLKYINLSNCHITEDIGKQFAVNLQRFQYLEHLDLSSNRAIGNSINDILSSLESSSETMKYLNFSDCKMTEESGNYLEKYLKTFSSLEYLNIRRNGNVCKSLKNITKSLLELSKTLTHVYIDFCGLSTSDRPIVESLLQSLSLEDFEL
ncbi:unnamed protein product [Dimorphilus gyrociliatus]|uniref:NACHT domain-containing protein n=1 Tax=Dimorphilus gyrociliatus TaxID=2664684 RepID=A0A7I8WEQ6_9ANNE|nr:unnamed protein product [Dimorphilus gyrociliatus]